VWEYQSTLQQLARLALIQTGDQTALLEESEPWLGLSSFFKGDATAVRTAFVGRVGLALSGGGFRAALYHIGVLAKLAELDVLRHVEVLSCVSGGSIVGAYYYLEVRHLLQTKSDGEVTRQDYIDIVKRIERNFVAGVQRNVRTRVLAGLLTNLRMVFQPGYSRTKRVGELYEREIFSRVEDGEGVDPRWLDALNVIPKGEDASFAPKRDNWRRRAKVPILVLNATTLNTGHGWQFTTSWMGESPSRIDTTIDGNDRFRRMYYWEAPERYHKIRLGHAVAASSCVPGLFEPLNLDALYPDRTVRLVDGGVSDNQGVSGLLDQDCNVVLVSDGSGQSESQPNPSAGILGVPLRSNTVLQARVRDAQYQELRARKRSSLFRGFMFVHLKRDLDVDPVDWVDCPDPYDASTDARPPSRRGPLTQYGIDKKVQALLAAIRTDLDSFADVEANALMTSGYRMTEHDFQHSVDLQGLASSDERQPWGFLAVEPCMNEGGKPKESLKRLLAVSKYSAFKVWRLWKPLMVTSGLLAAGLIALGYWIAATDPDWSLPAVRVRQLLVAIAMLGATAVVTQYLGRTILGIDRWRELLYRVAAGLGMSLIGWLAARIHLWIFDPLFLWLGSAERLERENSRGPVSRVEI
jgi:predicted acylesterase/phospholipase RssA